LTPGEVIGRAASAIGLLDSRQSIEAREIRSLFEIPPRII
jgi:hypothetical protein